MRVISFSRLRKFYEKHSDAETSLRVWNKTTEAADWQNFAEVRKTYRAASQVGNFVVFNIGGNKYRLITSINYKTKKVYIRDVLTHSEYDTNKWKNDDRFEP